jgi:hypothetical protein
VAEIGVILVAAWTVGWVEVTLALLAVRIVSFHRLERSGLDRGETERLFDKWWGDWARAALWPAYLWRPW